MSGLWPFSWLLLAAVDQKMICSIFCSIHSYIQVLYSHIQGFIIIYSSFLYSYIQGCDKDCLYYQGTHNPCTIKHSSESRKVGIIQFFLGVKIRLWSFPWLLLAGQKSSCSIFIYSRVGQWLPLLTRHTQSLYYHTIRKQLLVNIFPE